MATLTNLATGASKRPVYGVGAKPKKIGVYTLAFDLSYPTGGESIADVFNDFESVDHISISGSAARIWEVDYSTEKVLCYTAVGTEATNASNQSAYTVKLRVTGS